MYQRQRMATRIPPVKPNYLGDKVIPACSLCIVVPFVVFILPWKVYQIGIASMAVSMFMDPDVRFLSIPLVFMVLLLMSNAIWKSLKAWAQNRGRIKKQQ